MNPIIFDKQEPRISDTALLTRIWTNPVQVFRYTYAHKYDRYVHPFIWATGLLTTIRNEMPNLIPGNLSLKLIALEIIGCIAAAYLLVYAFAVFCSWTGRRLGATNSSTASIARVIAYARIPALAGLTIGCIVSIYILTGDHPRQETLLFWLSRTSGLAEGLLTIWTLILILTGIREVHHFGWGRTLINVLLTLLILAIPAGLVYWKIKS